MSMRTITDLKLGFVDAENYKRGENKQFLQEIFVRTNALDQICEPRTSFIVGEKGTGKTAYAVYICNTSYHDNFASIRYIRETDFQKFIALKRNHHLDLSDYSSIWKTIIYLLLSDQILDREKRFTHLSHFTLFSQLKRAIDEYYSNAFSPEIVNALHFVEQSQFTAALLAKFANVKGHTAEEVSFSESRFQTNLLFIRKKFEEAFSKAKLQRNHILFIDGIDIRPQSVPYEDYINCIKGLANAVWEVNNDFFSNIKDSPGRIRTVLLVRPDIFQFLGLQNQNTKIRDNSVLLDWRTNYAHHRTSELFKVVDHLLRSNNKMHDSTEIYWDHYFPFDSPNVIETFSGPSSFVGFLRLSLHRPRDLITMLRFLRDNVATADEPHRKQFSSSDIESPDFRNQIADYLLGEIKDQLLFYYSIEDYETFLKFFEFLSGKTQFRYREYESAFDAVLEYIQKSGSNQPKFMSSSSRFLQFLYDLNVICYIEEGELGQQFIRWCFRERSYSNIAPKVKLNEVYRVHSGLSRALNLGTGLRKRIR